MTAPIDIRPVDLAIVQDILRAVLPATAKVYVFGSRALWTTKDGSDLDVAIDVGRRLTREESLDLADAFEESDLPYKVDVVDLHNVSESFKAIVDRDKVELPFRPLNSFATLQRGNTYKGSLLGLPGPKLLGLGSIKRNGGFKSDNLKTYGGSSDPRMLLYPGDIYVSLKDVTQAGDLLGAVARVPESVPIGRLTQDTVKLVFQDNAPKNLIYWVLRSAEYRTFCRSYATGTTNLGLPRDDFLGFPIPNPTIERLHLVSVLDALEDKIELNRRMNETLEATARAIFKDWFVDFGPTRAKIEGQAPYLPPEIWSLFPDTLDDEGTPEGWITSTIGQEVEIVGGSTPSTKEVSYWGGDFYWATPKDLSSLDNPVLLGTDRKISKAGLTQIGSGLLPVGTVLLSSRAPIGYMAIAQVPVAVNQGFIAMICKKKLSNVFVWQWTHANMETVHQNANGSTFQEISKSNFKPIPVTVATPHTLEAFDDMIVQLFDRIVANEIESRSLAATRDFLLPKLMSGEVRVENLKTLKAAAQ